MKSGTRFAAATLAICLIFGAVGCADATKTPPDTGNETYTPITDFSDGIIDKQSDLTLNYVSSDTQMDDFLNDYYQRHIGYPSDKKVVNLDVGEGGTAWKEWESLSLMWNNTVSGVNTNRYARLKDWLDNIPVDRFGYVWSNQDDPSTPATNNSYTNFDQGWPFPSMESMGVRGYGWGTNCNVAPGTNGWSTRVKSFSSSSNAQFTYSSGNYVLSANGSGDVYIELSGIEKGYTFYAPFVEVGLNILGNSEAVIDDVYLQWQTADGNSYTVSYSEFGTQEKDFNQSNFRSKLFFSMPGAEGWGSSDNVYGDTGSPVTSMRLIFRPEDGKSLKGLSFYIDYFRTDFDTRCVQNNAIYLDSIVEYYKYTGSTEYLASKLDDCRRAFQFFLTYCNGADGLIDQDNFVGHDGVPLAGHGISAGYFDIVSLPSEDFYFNVYFYKAIQAMIFIEETAAEHSISGDEVSVVTPFMDGSEKYAQTAESLETLAQTCKEQIQKTFWNEEKGRFIEGYNDWDGELSRYVNASESETWKIKELASRGEEFDLGFLAFNVEAVAVGVATDEQARLIMEWVDGQRTIAGDDSTGEDLYYFECAPRFTTINNDYWFYCGVATDENYPFSQQVQNGGSCLWISYYDILARAKVFGADNAYKRLQGIQNWYQDVMTAYEQAVQSGAADSAKEFYRAYYYDLAECSDAAYDVFNSTYNQKHISLQGQVNGKDSAGALGLDAEFLENSILSAAIPFTFFGLDVQDDNLCIAPNLPSDVEYMKMENLAFRYLKYDLCVGDNFVRITDVDYLQVVDGQEGLYMTVRFRKPTSEYRVYLNGEILETGVEEQGDFVVAQVPFDGRDIFVKIG